MWEKTEEEVKVFWIFSGVIVPIGTQIWGKITHSKIKYFLCKTTDLIARPRATYQATWNLGSIIPSRFRDTPIWQKN